MQTSYNVTLSKRKQTQKESKNNNKYKCLVHTVAEQRKQNHKKMQTFGLEFIALDEANDQTH